MSAFAGPSRTTYQAKIIKPDGYPLEASSVNFKFTILDPAGSCILYSETYSSVNMSATGGLISFALGSGVKTYPVSATTFENVFSNITPSLSCDVGGPSNYAPTASDSRKIVMQFHDGNGWQTLPAMSINAVPYAMYANDAQKLNGKTDTDFVQVSVVPTCTASEAIRYNGTSFSCVAVGSGGAVTSGSVITALGYTPADGVSVTTLTSNISTVSSTVSSLSTSVSSLSSTVVGLSASMAAITSSQWTTSATTINYLAGNVGIGTTAPSAALEVSGGIKLSGTAATLDIPLTTSTTGYITMNGERLLHASEDYSIFLGRGAGNLAGTGVQDTGIGHQALKSITFGYENVALGDFAMTDMTTGGENTALGSQALSNSVSGVANVAVGIQALMSNMSDENTVVGAYALNRAGNGSKNTGTGYAVMNMLTTGSNNVGAGWMALRNISTGSSNIAIGYNAGSNITTGSGNIIIGGNTGASFATESNNISINDGVGNERIRVVSSGLVGIGTTTPVTKLDVLGAIRISMDSVTCSAGYAGSMRYNSGNVEFCNGTTWAAFGVSGAGITNLNGSASGAQTFATGISGTVFNISSSNGIHTFNIPLAATGSVTAGLLSNADYVTFTNKLNATSAAVISALGYTPIDNSVSATFALRANNLSDLSSSATARTNLGLGSLAQLNFIDLSGSQASGTLAAARLPAFSGDVSSSVGTAVLTLANVGAGVTSGTQYTKVTVDGKGRVTSGAQLSTADVTTALGYTPASATAASQWTTSGTTINYTTGNVGIGTANPQSLLDVAGNTGSSPSLRIYNTDTADGRSTIRFKNDRTSVYEYEFGIDPGGGNAKNFAIRDLSASGSPVRFVVNSSGNVGIGTIAPAAKLDVSGSLLVKSDIVNHDSSDFRSALSLTHSGTGTGYGNGSTVVQVFDNMEVVNFENGYLMFKTQDLERMRITASGDVGVGIAAPTARLHLTSGTTSVAPLRLTSSPLLTTAVSGAIEYDGTSLYYTDGTNTRRVIAANTSSGTYSNVSNINSTANITLTPTGSVVVSSTTASTNSTTGALIVNGGAGIAGALNVGGIISGSAMIKGTGFRANQGAPDAADSSTVGYAFGQDGDTGIFSPGSGAANGIISFYNNNAETMRINPGAVGIGTSNPSFPLDIQGSNAFQQRIYHASNNANDDAAIMMTRTRGTTSAAAGVQSGDSIGGMYFRAHDGTSTNTTNAYIEVEAGETHSPTNRGSIMTFASTIASAATNTEIMRIHSNGYVGIGSTAPNALLQVGPTGSQSTNYNVYVGSYNSSAGQGSYVGNWASSVYWGLGPATAASDNTLRLGNAANRTGTWAGTQNLNLVMGGNLAVGSGTASTYKFLATKDFNGISSETAAFIGGTDAGTAATGIYVVQKDNISLATNTSYLLNVVHNNNSKFLVTGAGNVGIGTAAPLGGLHVKSSPSWSANNYGPSVIVDGARNNALALLDSTSGNPWAIANAGGVLSFSSMPALSDTTTAASIKMTITSSGNVGIGTTSPNAKLDVVGDVKVSGSLLSSNATGALLNLGNNDWTWLLGDSTGAVYDATEMGVKISTQNSYGLRNRTPIDPNATYRVEVRIKKLSGNGVIYIGADSLDANFNSVFTDLASSYNYFGASAENLPAGSEQTYVGFISGYNLASEGSANKFDPGSKYFNIIIITNYGGSGASVVKSVHLSKVDGTYVLANGNVGIGTTTPREKIDTSGNVKVGTGTASSLNYVQLTGHHENSVTGGYGSGFRMLFDSSNDLFMITREWSGWNNDPTFVINRASQNVGIGTASPAATLHVSGTVRVVDGNQAAGRVLASDASGNAAWKQTIIHGTITSTGNSSTAIGQRVSSGVSITLPPGRWNITGMGITTAASCRADFGIRTLADAVVKYTLMPVATGDFQTATVTGYVDIAVTTTYELWIGSRAACTSQIHVDNTLWELTATGVAY